MSDHADGWLYTEQLVRCRCTSGLLTATIPDPDCPVNHLPAVVWRSLPDGSTAYGDGPYRIVTPPGVSYPDPRPIPALAHLKPARHIGPEENAERSRKRNDEMWARATAALAKAEYDAIWVALREGAS